MNPSPHPRHSPSGSWRISRIGAHALAVGGCLLASLALGRLAASGHGAPSLILLPLPITVSALLGGLGPGLAATIATAVGLHLSPTPGQLAIESGQDILCWIALFGHGVLVSLLGEGLLRSRRREAQNIRELRAARTALEAQHADLEERVHERTAELAASEAKFHALVEQSMVGIFIQQAGYFQYANPALAKIRGCASPMDIIGRRCDEFVVPEERERIHGIALDPVQEDHFRFRGLRADGTEIEIETWQRPIEYEGRPATIGISVDITERHRAETALRESEARQRLAIAASNIGLWDWDMPAQKVVYSREYKAQLGYGEDEIGDDFSEWQSRVHPDDLERVFAIRETLFGNPHEKELEAEFRMRHRDGSWRWIFTHCELLRDAAGRPYRMLGCHLDITERKRMEEKLREANRHMQMALDAAGMGVWMWDIQTDKVRTLRGKGPVSGLNKACYPRTGEAFWALVHPDDRSTVMEGVRRALEEKQRFAAEFRLVVPGREVRYVQDFGQCLFDEQGKPSVLTGVDLDITERKRLEQDLARALAQQTLLARRILTVQEEERRQLARELHDEIGQVLTAVKINLQTALLAATPGVPRERLQGCVDITDQAIQQVRGRSLALRPSLLDDLGLIPALEHYLERQAELGTCAVEFKAQPLTERAAPETEIACYRVMQEAVTNALRHAGATRIQVSFSVDEDRFRLQVLDDGRGFDVDAARRQALAGVSFGLLGMEERALLAGGGLAVESTPGRGSAIRAWFPRAHRQ